HITGAIAQNLAGAGIKIDAVPDNAFAFRTEEAALLFMPDRAFAAGTIAGAADKTVPVGLLVMKRVAPVVQGQVPAPERLAMLGTAGDARVTVVLFLGVRKEADGPVLEVYSREMKPLYQTPLKRLEASSSTALCSGKIANLDQAAERADLVLTFDGKYEATLRLGASN
ncbi:MAG: hypothetical protein K0Q72_5508, partial [Armatimonadetes bacterium]|nr:hypothetical protein [Armatimonadota bacterium]